MSSRTPQQILAIELEDNDADAATIGQYLFTLTRKIWHEEEGFDGKRPFGNSGWTSDITKALILNKVIDGTLDDDGWIDDFSQSELETVMNSVFDFLLKADYSSFALPPEPRDWYVLKFDSYGDLVDKEESAFTKDGAEKQVEFYKRHSNYHIWKAVHIPQ